MLLLYGSIVLAVLHWIFTARTFQMGIYLTKPTVMLLLIGWLVFSGMHQGVLPLLWFVLALTFCLGGDVFLMLPERWFRAGLAFFLVGHIFYIAGFSATVTPKHSAAAAALIALLLVGVGMWVVRKLFAGLEAHDKKNLRIPILAYAIIISIMLFSASRTLFDPLWPASAGWMACMGALFPLVAK